MSVLYPFAEKSFLKNSGRKPRKFYFSFLISFAIVLCFAGSANGQEVSKEEQVRIEKLQKEKEEAAMTQKLNSYPAHRRGIENNSSKKQHVSPRELSYEEQLKIKLQKAQAEKPAAIQNNTLGVASYEIFTNAKGEYFYKILFSGQEILTQFVGNPTDNTVANRNIAQQQAQIALDVYKKNLQYSKEELKSEILYQARLQSKNNSGNPDVMNNQNVMATCNFSGTLQAGDPQITGRIFRDGLASTCAAPKTCPAGTPFGAGLFNYDTYTIANGTGSTQCVTVGGVSGNGEQFHIVAYLGSFDPLNQCQNYLADQGGSSIATPVNFSFNLANGATVILVCYNPINGGTTTPYSITVDNCPVPSCFPITITGQPVNASACPGTNATFNVSATAPGLTGLSYNWQEDRGSGYTYLSNGGVYSGVNTASLQLTGVNSSMNGYKYRCIMVCSAGGLPVITNEATLTVNPVPNNPLILPPAPIICIGGSVQLNVLNGQIFNSSGGPIVINTSGPATPYPSAIAVSGLPVGATIKSVTINGISHTWSDDVDILLQSPLGTNVVLMSDVGSSADFINHVYTFDDAAAANMTTGAAPASGLYKPTNIGATDTWDAPLPASITQAAPAISMFGAETNGTWNLFVRDDVGGDGGTISSWSITFELPGGMTAVFSPQTGLFTDAGLTTPYVAGTFVSTVYAAPTSTTTYLAQASNGTCNSFPGTNVTVTVKNPPAITTQPANVSTCVGTGVSIPLTATGSDLTFQWQVSTNGGTTYSNITGTANNPSGLIYTNQTASTLNINTVMATMNNYKYRCIISGSCTPSVTSAEVTLSVNTALPTISVTKNNECAPAILTASGASTYSWSPSAGLSATTGSVVTATPSVNTIYTVTGTDAATGCVGTTTVDVKFTPPVPTIAPAAPVICVSTVQPLSITSSSLPPVPVTVSSGNITVAIPDNEPINGVTHDLIMSGVTGPVQSISVTFNITHTWDADLDINLVAPNGNILNLVGARGGSGDNFTNTTISSTSTTSLATGTAPFSGTFAADGFIGWGPSAFASNVATFSSLFSVPNGTWKIAIADFAGLDVGTLNSWSITINQAAPDAGIWSPVTGLFSNPAGTVPYVAGTPATTVYASPAATTTYSVAVTSTGKATRTFSSGGNITAPANAPVSTVSGAGTPYPSQINISGIPANATVKSVTLKRIRHSFPDDLDVLLQSPSGTNVVLMSDAGGATDLTGETFTIDDAASNTLADGALNATGTYKPTNFGSADTYPAPIGAVTQATPALSMFTGDPNGTWSLYVNDDLGGDVGLITSWEITFQLPADVNCTSTPATVTVTVHNPIVFTTHPQNRTVCQNGSTSFTVAATGTILTTQWQLSTNGGTTWTNVSGATSTTLTLSNIQTSQNGHRYRCVMSNVGCGSVTSQVAILTVNPLPTVSLSLNPAGQTQLRPGMLTTVTVNSSPAGASYQWFVNGVANPGITGSSYTVDAYHLGTYTVRVTDVNGCVNTTAGVTFEAIPSTNLFIYPNPTSGAYFVTYYMPAVGSPVTINVIDMKGRTMLQRFERTSAPYTRFDFSASGLAAGVYVIEFRDPSGDRLAAGRLVVTR